MAVGGVGKDVGKSVIIGRCSLKFGLAKLINRKTPSWGMTRFLLGIIRGSKETVWSCFSVSVF